MNQVAHKRPSEETTTTTSGQMSFPWPKRFVFGLQHGPTQIPLSFKWGPELPHTKYIQTEIHPESMR
jgi:hypothetical protein